MIDLSAGGRNRPLVLHVIDSLGITGGAEKQLTRNLAAFDHDLMRHEVALVQSTATTRLDEVGPEVEIHELFGARERVSRAGLILRLRQLVARRRPSLIHASLPDSALATRVVAATTRVRAVESLVNISHERVRTVDNPNVTMAKLRVHTVLDRSTMRFLTGYHAVSRAVADSWADVVGLDREKIKIIPRGIEVAAVELDPGNRAEAARSVRSEFGFEKGSQILLTVGRVEPQKGHRYLMEALARLAPAYPGIRALIVGRPGRSSAAIDRLIEQSGLGAVVTLTGSRRDLPRLLAAADIFVFPSLFEGNGGNAMIEAMAAGLPIVTTDAAPMTDLIPSSEVGMLVGRRDSSGFEAAIAALLDDPELRRRLGAAARERALTFPTPPEVAKDHQRWYLDLLST